MSVAVGLPHLLQGQVVGEGALHVVVLTGRVHVVGAHLQTHGGTVGFTDQRSIIGCSTGPRWTVLTSSTVFLRLVSLRVSSTKLPQRPLQSSGSSAV